MIFDDQTNQTTNEKNNNRMDAPSGSDFPVIFIIKTKIIRPTAAQATAASPIFIKVSNGRFIMHVA